MNGLAATFDAAARRAPISAVQTAPFVFVTGYGRSAVLRFPVGVPLFEKPLDPRSLARLLAA